MSTGVDLIRYRAYGETGPLVFVLHGGPGAPGYMAPVASELSHDFSVIEPFQRWSGEIPLIVQRHIDDLQALIVSVTQGEKVALVGHSWGAMLALAYAAQYPNQASCIIAVSSGTFTPDSRQRMNEILSKRMSPEVRAERQSLEERISDPDELMHAKIRLILPLYDYDAIASQEDDEEYDGRGNEETWADMLKLQRQGVYPAGFKSISSPVLMLHGSYDPHPGEMIRDSLLPYIPQLEYVEWERCGHYPWLEKAVREDFFTHLRGWLRRNLDDKAVD